jgi:Lysine methyltransferase
MDLIREIPFHAISVFGYILPVPATAKFQTKISSSTMFPIPAHQTKDVSLLHYPITPFRNVDIIQKAPLDSVSTGTTLYLSSQLLAHYICETLPKGKRAIELGAGTGLVSLALGILGWEVWATDLSNVIDDVLSTNIQRNRQCEKIVVQELDWHKESWEWITDTDDDGFCPTFDLIVCADGVYAIELILPLLRTLRTLSAGNSPLILIAFERRDPAVIDSFFEHALSYGFTRKRINLRRILGRHLTRWGWTSEDFHSAEIWSMRCTSRDLNDSTSPAQETSTGKIH